MSLAAVLALAATAFADTGLDTGTGQDTAPVALAGSSFMAYPDDVVVLDGSGSYDDDGDPLGYRWTQVGGPDVGLSKGDTANPEWTAAQAGTHTFELVVTDGQAFSAPDRVDVIVVDPGAGTRFDDQGGCATAPAMGGLALVLLGLVRRRAGEGA